MLAKSFRLFRIAICNKRGIGKLIGIVTALELISIALLYLLNSVYGKLYSGIELHDSQAIWLNIGKFSVIAMILVVVGGYLTAISNRLAFSIRCGITTHCSDNIDTYTNVKFLNQRIQEDVRKFSDSSVELWIAVSKAVLKLPIFLGVVVSLTQWYVGLIVLSLVIAGTYLTRYMAKKLAALQSYQEQNEAEFRATLGGASWIAIMLLFNKLNYRLKLLSFTQNGLGQAFVLVPFIVMMPMYIAGSIKMGAFFQSVNALGKVIDSLMILIDSRQTIVEVESSLIRLEFITESKDF